MLDNTIPSAPVILFSKDTTECEKFELPNGFSFCEYKDGMGLDWVRLVMLEQSFSSFAEAIEYFETAILSQPAFLSERLFFVKEDKTEAIVGTGALWRGTDFGKSFPRISFLAVAPEFQGTGIAKAIVSKMLDSFNAQPKHEFIYVLAQTRSYALCNLFLLFDFEPYFGKKPMKWSGTEAIFEKTKFQAWQLIMEKIHEKYPDIEIFDYDEDDDDDDDDDE